ncbi:MULTISPECIES: glycosyltransferase family 32 protein [unclassified Acinetobacter]|uniref:glycosyltransferase family 32 protein n=1 Tax=Acinetobacter TaxID=469 RepID=UPI0015D1522B|nr:MULTISPECIES: glycosyltransferase [unclassified Acinetobacter]
MIPKIIHYCWFGPNEISENQLKYINQWKELCPEWEIILWNETNFDVNSIPFTKKAYELKKYAFVTDYVRVWALNKFGGVYLDTDVELKKNIEYFLQYDAFSCFETEGIPFTSAVWGSKKNHSLLTNLLFYYENKEYSLSEEPNTLLIGSILKKEFNIDPNLDIDQVGYDGNDRINIFSSNYFCLDLPENYASHHFFDSWALSEKKVPYKKLVHDKYYLSKLNFDSDTSKNIIKQFSGNLTFKNLLLIIRYYLKSKFK